MLNPQQSNSHGYGVFGLAWRALAAGALYILGFAVGGMVMTLLGLPASSLESTVSMPQIMGWMFVTGILYGIVLGLLAQRLAIRRLARFAVFFSLSFMLGSLLNVVEAIFFSALPVAEQMAGLVAAAFGHAGLALALALLFQPREEPRRMRDQVRETLQQRTWFSWLWRITLAGVLFLPIYFFFGLLIAPIVIPYYNDPNSAFKLVVPGLEVMLPVEIVRGLLMVLTVFPVVALWHRSRLSLWLWLGLTMAVLIGIGPLLAGVFLPVTLRLVHSLEITADSFVHAFVIVGLLAVGSWRVVRQLQPGLAPR